MNWAYIAGFFDGEGSIDVKSGRIAIFQSDPTPLRVIATFLLKNGVKAGVYGRPTPRKSNFGVWCEGHCIRIGEKASIAKFIDGVFPYLLVKKQRCEDVRRFLKLYPGMDLSVVGKLGRQKSTSSYGYGMWVGLGRDPVTGRWISRRVHESP